MQERMMLPMHYDPPTGGEAASSEPRRRQATEPTAVFDPSKRSLPLDDDQTLQQQQQQQQRLTRGGSKIPAGTGSASSVNTASETLDWAAFQPGSPRPSSVLSIASQLSETHSLLDEGALESSVDMKAKEEQDYYEQQVFKSKRDVLATLLQETQSILVDLAERTPPQWPVREPAHAMDPPPYDDPRSPVLHVLDFGHAHPRSKKAAETHATTAALTESAAQDAVWVNASADLATLHDRLMDPSSKVLVTGDINAGKSTLINSLLHREVLWTDQQPSTNTFTEILSTAHNDDIEEVHAIHPAPAQYNAKDPTSFTTFDIHDLPRITGFPRLRAFVDESSLTASPRQSLLANGVVDLHLIDSPGLNRHSTHTTAIFARQKKIDAVVFVVSAENHFTQSATDFLQTTCKEKPLVFIVVNKFDGIHDTKRCRREILSQLKAISPQTYARSDELVHFVSARDGGPTFAHLQSQLRGFLLEKRRFSKLAPTKRFLTHMLQDITTVCHHNLKEASAEEQDVSARQAKASPLYHKLEADQAKVIQSLEHTAAQTLLHLEQHHKEAWLPFMDDFKAEMAVLPWLGLFSARAYAESIRSRFTEKWMATRAAVASHRQRSVSSSIVNLHALVTAYGATVTSQTDDVGGTDFLLDDRGEGEAPLFAIERRDIVRFSGGKFIKAVLGTTLLTIGTGAYKYTKHVTLWVGEKITGRKNSDGTKWIVGTVGICGISYLAYQTLTLRSSIERRLLVKAELAVRPMVQKEQMEAMVQASQLILRQQVYAAQNAYMRLLDEQRQRLAGWQQRHATAMLATKWFQQRKASALHALHQVHAVEIDM